MLGPVREELFTPTQQRARQAILDAAAEIDMPTRQVQPLLDDLQNGIPFMGIEAFRPAFAGELTTLFDYLPQNALLVSVDPMAIAEQAVHVWDHYQKGRESFLGDGALSLPAEVHALNLNQMNARTAQFNQIRCHALQMVDELGLVEVSEEPLAFRIPTQHGLDQPACAVTRRKRLCEGSPFGFVNASSMACVSSYHVGKRRSSIVLNGCSRALASP